MAHRKSGPVWRYYLTPDELAELQKRLDNRVGLSMPDGIARRDWPPRDRHGRFWTSGTPGINEDHYGEQSRP